MKYQTTTVITNAAGNEIVTSVAEPKMIEFYKKFSNYLPYIRFFKKKFLKSFLETKITFILCFPLNINAPIFLLIYD